MDGQIDWNSIKEVILNAANTTLKSERLAPRKSQVTKEILDFIKERTLTEKNQQSKNKK